MKKILCALLLLLILAFCVPVSAELGHNEMMDSMISLTKMALGDEGYNEVTYNESLNSIIIKSGVSGFADMVQTMISCGVEASYEMWVEYKAGTLSFYESIVNFYEVAEMSDLGLVFIVVNDNVYIDNDTSGMPSPYLLVIMDGEYCFDIIGELNGY